LENSDLQKLPEAEEEIIEIYVYDIEGELATVCFEMEEQVYAMVMGWA